MARVTVEDCIRKIDNRFDLVVLSAQRTRQIQFGAQPTIDRDNDKNPVIALREIAEGTISLDELDKVTVQSFRRHISPKDEREDELDAILDQDATKKSKSIEIGRSESAPETTETPAPKAKTNIEIGATKGSPVKKAKAEEEAEDIAEEEAKAKTDAEEKETKT